jgi:transposase
MYSPTFTKARADADRLMKRVSVVAMWKRTQNVSAVARHFKVTRGYVQRWRDRHLETKDLTDAPRSGRPRKVGVLETARLLALVAKKSNRMTCGRALRNQLQLVDVSTRTVRRALKREGARYRKPKGVRILTPANVSKRYAFAKKYHDGGPWKKTMFTDSTYIVNGQGKARWVLANEENIHLFHKAPTKVHVYAGIWHSGRTKLLFVTGTTGHKPYHKRARGVGGREYRESIVPNCFIPALPPGGHFMHDGAPAHTAKATKLYMDGWVGRDKWLHDWPPNSCDLNPIENIWHCLKDGVRGVNYEDMDQFKAAVVEAWEAIPQETINRCIGSVHRRLRAVAQAQGGATLY